MTLNKERLEKIIRTHNYKLTRQRKLVLGTISKNKGKHLSVKEIFKEVKKKNKNIGLVTIYRTLSLLEKIGLIQHNFLDGRCIKYQLKKPEEKHEHHHLICNMCGDVAEIDEDMLGFLEEKIRSKRGFMVTDHRLYFLGICKKCLNNFKKQQLRK